MTITASRRESDDGYAGVVARLNARWRVIVCRDAIQWILQHIKFRRGQSEWQGWKYHRTRDGLIRSSTAEAGGINPSALAVLHALPPRVQAVQP